MKKFFLIASASLLILSTAACSSNGSSADKANQDSTAVKTADPFEAQTNIRYIDMDSITEHYNLAKDYKEWLLKKNESLEKQIRALYASVQKFEADCQRKAQNNGYLTEASYKADVQKYQNMATNAAKKEQELRRQAAEEDAQWTRQLQDSINSFVIDYNKEYRYDAILLKAAGIYFNPSLDITKDVIEGLNARYNNIEVPKEAKKEEKTDSTATKK